MLRSTTEISSLSGSDEDDDSSDRASDILEEDEKDEEERDKAQADGSAATDEQRQQSKAAEKTRRLLDRMQIDASSADVSRAHVNEEDGQLSRLLRSIQNGTPFLPFRYTPDELLLAYRALFLPPSYAKENADTIQSLLKNAQQALAGKPRWAICMASGGHFAAVIVDVRSQQILQSKSFHRYTVRRKQGGGQGGQDAKGKKAHSAGSDLRRHNELALEQVRLFLFFFLSSDTLCWERQNRYSTG